MSSPATVSPQDSGDSVAFQPVTLTPLAGDRQTEDTLDISGPEYSRIILQRASGKSVDVVPGKASDPVAFRAVWYEASLSAALTAARADLDNWGKQRLDLEVEGQSFANCVMSQPAPGSFRRKEVAGVHGVSFLLLFRAIP